MPPGSEFAIRPTISVNQPARLSALRSRLARSQLDCLLVSQQANVFYLTGFTGSAGLLLVDERSSTLYTDGRYALQAEQEVRGSRVVVVSSGTTKAALTRARRWRRVGFEASADYRLFRLLAERVGIERLRHCENAVEQLRLIKDEQELEQIRRSVALNSLVFQETVALLRPGLAEQEVAAELEYRMRRYGAQRPAFETIVAGGPRSAWPHARASLRPLGKKEFLLLDHGAILANYASDMTRTVHLGTASRRAKALYRVVKEAQERAIGAVRAGASCAAVDRAARRHIARCGYGAHFPHSTGHGVGIQVHEMPGIAAREKTRLPAGAVITIEPGVYIPGYSGVRIEDIVVVRNQGAEVLTTTPKELLQIE